MHFGASNMTSWPLASVAPDENASPRVTRIPQPAHRALVVCAAASSEAPRHPTQASAAQLTAMNVRREEWLCIPQR